MKKPKSKSNSETLLTLSREAWAVICDAGLECEVLETAETEGREGLRRLMRRVAPGVAWEIVGADDAEPSRPG